MTRVPKEVFGQNFGGYLPRVILCDGCCYLVRLGESDFITWLTTATLRMTINI